MPVRYDRHIGTIEILDPVRTDEGFLKVHGIAARTGVLYYQGAGGKITAELIPPEELFDEASLATLGGKPLTNDHPRTDEGVPILVDPENVDEHGVGTVGNDFRASRANGFVRVVIDAHQAAAINDIDKGKRQLSTGRTVERIDATPGIWDERTQQYWLGADAEGKPGVGFDSIQRGLRYNHVAIVDRGRAGERVSIRMDSGDAVQVEPPTNGGLPMAKIRIDGVEYEVDSGVAGAIAAQQNGHSAAVEALKTEAAVLTTKVQRADAALEVEKVKASDLQTKLDSIDVRSEVQKRLELERSVAHLKIDGLSAMADRDVQVAAIKSIKADFDDAGKDSATIAVYFDAFSEMISTKQPATNDGRGGIRTARQIGRAHV